MATLKRYFPIFIIALVGLGIQLGLTAAGKVFYLTQLTMSAYYSLVVIGLCLLMGYAGQISLGHAGFFAIGAYCSAAMTTADCSGLRQHAAGRLLSQIGGFIVSKDLYGDELVRLNPWIACVAALTSGATLSHISSAAVAAAFRSAPVARTVSTNSRFSTFIARRT